MRWSSSSALTGRGAARQRAFQIRAVEILAERLRAHAEERLIVGERVGADQVYAAEAARVVERQKPPLLRFEQEVVVGADRVRLDPPAPRHAQVEDHRVAAIGVDQAIFGTAPERGDARPGQPLAQVVGEGPAKVRAAGLDGGEPAPLQHGTKTAHGGLDFGKLGHVDEDIGRLPQSPPRSC